MSDEYEEHRNTGMLRAQDEHNPGPWKVLGGSLQCLQRSSLHKEGGNAKAPNDKRLVSPAPSNNLVELAVAIYRGDGIFIRGIPPVNSHILLVVFQRNVINFGWWILFIFDSPI